MKEANKKHQDLMKMIQQSQHIFNPTQTTYYPAFGSLGQRAQDVKLHTDKLSETSDDIMT